MSELGEYTPKAGHVVFGPEMALVQAAADECEGGIGDMIGQVATRVAELSGDNPYIGKRIRFRLSSALKIEQYGADATVETIELAPGEHELDLQGFHLSQEHDIDGQTVFPALGLTLGVEGMDDCVACVDPEDIEHMELVDTTHPFVYDQSLLKEALDGWGDVEARYPEADFVDFMEEFVMKLATASDLRDAEVELLLCDQTEVCLCSPEERPDWADNGIALQQTFENDLRDDDTKGYALSRYRGKISGKFAGYDLESPGGYEDEAADDDDQAEDISENESNPVLTVQILLDIDHPLVKQDPSIRYVQVCVDDISWGRVVSSPKLN